jgi:hypothetical protein
MLRQMQHEGLGAVVEHLSLILRLSEDEGGV